MLMSEQVGCLMIRQVTFINWNYIGDAIPSFVTIAFMPFSYSVAYGLMALVCPLLTPTKTIATEVLTF